MLTWVADLLVYRLIGLSAGTHLGDAVHFFVYDTLKILIMLSLIIYLVSIVRSFFPPERARELLGGRALWAGHVAAASLGVVTPFCSCSAVPVFIGFIESGVPLGVTFSFLISAPMVNEVAAVLLWGLFGWRIAAIYVLTGLSVAIVAGAIIGRLRMERFVEEYVYQIKVGAAGLLRPTWGERHRGALETTTEILRKVMLYVLVGIAIGGAIHGYAPTDWLVVHAGPQVWYAVPLAVLVGVPLYSNAAGMIPVVGALMEKGLPIGTVLAFMMAVTALSLPELIILRKVLKPALLALFVGVMTVTIIGVGYLFNALIT